MAVILRQKCSSNISVRVQLCALDKHNLSFMFILLLALFLLSAKSREKHLAVWQLLRLLEKKLQELSKGTKNTEVMDIKSNAASWKYCNTLSIWGKPENLTNRYRAVPIAQKMCPLSFDLLLI